MFESMPGDGTMWEWYSRFDIMPHSLLVESAPAQKKKRRASESNMQKV